MKIFNLFRKKEPAQESTFKESVSLHVEDVCLQSSGETNNSEDEETGEMEHTQNHDENSNGKIKIIHNLIILDESGSMQAIYLSALGGLNETLQMIRCAEKKHVSQKHFVSLIAFDSEHYNEIYNHTPAEKAIDITNEQYRPGGCTPLYDAMGRAINELRYKVEKEDTVLVTVVTDGYENASREYNGSAIKALVEAMKAEGWIFTYIGANQDVERVANSMSINNHLSFDTTPNSTKDMFLKERKARKRFFDNIDSNVPKEKLREDYFEGL